jgi:hypothetical protein
MFAGFLLGLFLSREDGGDMILRNVDLAFNRLHRVISQKTEFCKLYWFLVAPNTNKISGFFALSTEQVNAALQRPVFIRRGAGIESRSGTQLFGFWLFSFTSFALARVTDIHTDHLLSNPTLRIKCIHFAAQERYMTY